MSTDISVEERLTAIEAAVNELQKKLADSHSENWLQQITGSFKDEPAFEEILAYGQAVRQENYPLDESFH